MVNETKMFGIQSTSVISMSTIVLVLVSILQSPARTVTLQSSENLSVYGNLTVIREVERKPL